MWPNGLPNGWPRAAHHVLPLLVIIEKGKQKLQVKSGAFPSVQDAQELIIHIATMYCDNKIQDSELKSMRDSLMPKQVSYTKKKECKRPAAAKAATPAAAPEAAAQEDDHECDITRDEPDTEEQVMIENIFDMPAEGRSLMPARCLLHPSHPSVYTCSCSIFFEICILWGLHSSLAVGAPSMFS